MPKKLKPTKLAVTESDYRALGEFRYHIDRYLDFSDQAAKAAGLEPKQYRLLLAIKALPQNTEPTIGVLAERLHVRHHSAVELVNRAAANRLVERIRSGSYVAVHLTRQGQRVLARAVEKRLDQLKVAGPLLVNALQQLNRNQTSKRKQK